MARIMNGPPAARNLAAGPSEHTTPAQQQVKPQKAGEDRMQVAANDGWSQRAWEKLNAAIDPIEQMMNVLRRQRKNVHLGNETKH